MAMTWPYSYTSINLFEHGGSRHFIHKQKTFEKIIMMKKKCTENKQVIVGFCIWGNPKNRIIQGHGKGPAKGIKDKL